MGGCPLTARRCGCQDGLTRGLARSTLDGRLMRVRSDMGHTAVRLSSTGTVFWAIRECSGRKCCDDIDEMGLYGPRPPPRFDTRTTMAKSYSSKRLLIKRP
jgi:hypothetical protein